VLSCLKYTKFL